MRLLQGGSYTMKNRNEYLLKVCLELLQKQEKSQYVLDLLSETIHYDGEDCDGTV